MSLDILVEILRWPVIWKDREGQEQAMDIEVEEENWTTSIIKYIRDGTLLLDKGKKRRLITKAVCYTIFREHLYKKSYSSPLLRCVTPKEAQYALVELHDGECGSHSEGRSLTHRALTRRVLLADHESKDSRKSFTLHPKC
ncbi:uncharacterized protein LOC119985551 [Tripterygium wilfordii]|uniref:uncharacterized protein LOC119985551 n=1 Tax=Tripterygium wilfordii TaxID=458696 RepID=UPI0018F84A92|nr:uncharacterized protein LOC119985551 [Tripterygium wilfordii]